MENNAGLFLLLVGAVIGYAVRTIREDRWWGPHNHANSREWGYRPRLYPLLLGLKYDDKDCRYCKATPEEHSSLGWCSGSVTTYEPRKTNI